MGLNLPFKICSILRLRSSVALQARDGRVASAANVARRRSRGSLSPSYRAARKSSTRCVSRADAEASYDGSELSAK
jgi:hypothetical protein